MAIGVTLTAPGSFILFRMGLTLFLTNSRVHRNAANFSKNLIDKQKGSLSHY
jgi:hypothetical protein